MLLWIPKADVEVCSNGLVGLAGDGAFEAADVSWVDFCSAARRARYARVVSSCRSRQRVILESAALAWRSPPRLSRWRVVRPEDAWTGATPQR